MKLKSASLIVALAVMLTACAKEQPGNDSTAVPADLVAGNTAFALDLYHRLAVQEGNLFFSPHSLSTALAMTHAGARGETERDLAALLHFTLPSDQVPGAFGALDRRLGEISKQKQVRLSVANSLWGQRDQPFTDQFLAVTRQHFGAQIGLVDFVGAAERARQKINTWVARKTGDKIQNLLAPGAVGPTTRLVLGNAIYFKGDWARPFDRSATAPADFFVTPTRSVQAPLMYLKTKIRGQSFDGFSAFELPYQGETLSMIVLLPEARDGLAALEATLTANHLHNWLAALDAARPEEAMVYLPKFKLEWKSDLKPTLAALSRGVAFDARQADFSGMTGNRDLFISAVIHQAVVEVNEQGTEAAAATGVVVALTDLPPPPRVFRADHPFIFLIREKSSGSVLFLGRVVDPTR
ncbi:MAG: serpin family protein [Verrucomicrobia bacterium]|nr:serpin family protein [Verrucomicrobiota bacterium]